MRNNVYLSPPKPRSSNAPPRSCWPRSTLKIKRKRDAEATTVVISGSPVGTWQVFTSSQQSRKFSLTEKEMSQGREGNLSSGPWLCNHREIHWSLWDLEGRGGPKGFLDSISILSKGGGIPCNTSLHMHIPQNHRYIHHGVQGIFPIAQSKTGHEHSLPIC